MTKKKVIFRRILTKMKFNNKKILIYCQKCQGIKRLNFVRTSKKGIIGYCENCNEKIILRNQIEKTDVERRSNVKHTQKNGNS